MSDPLDPKEAATLFYAGHAMAYVADPTSPFVCGQWMGQRSYITRLPFDEAGAEAYFTDNPVILYTAEASAPPSGPPPVSVWISSGTDTQLDVGGTKELTAFFNDEDDKEVPVPAGVTYSWSVADEDVVTLSSSSANPTTATGENAGVTRVTLETSGGSLTSTLTDTVDLTVTAPAR